MTCEQALRSSYLIKTVKSLYPHLIKSSTSIAAITWRGKQCVPTNHYLSSKANNVSYRAFSGISVGCVKRDVTTQSTTQNCNLGDSKTPNSTNETSIESNVAAAIENWHISSSKLPRSTQDGRREQLPLFLAHLFRIHFVQRDVHEILVVLPKSSDGDTTSTAISLLRVREALNNMLVLEARITDGIDSTLFSNWTNEDDTMSLMQYLVNDLIQEGYTNVSSISQSIILHTARKIVFTDKLCVFQHMQRRFESMYRQYNYEIEAFSKNDITTKQSEPVSRDLFREQLRLETRSRDRSISDYRQQKDSLTHCGLDVSMNASQRAMLHWYDGYVRAIAQKQKEVTLDRRRTTDSQCYLCLLQAPTLAVIGLHSVLGNTMRVQSGMRTVSVVKHVGKAIEEEASLALMQPNSRRRLRRSAGLAKSLLSLRQTEFMSSQKSGAKSEPTHDSSLESTLISQKLVEGNVDVSVPLVNDETNYIQHPSTKTKSFQSKQSQRQRMHPALRAANAETMNVHYTPDEWSLEVLVKIGGILVDLLVKSAFLPAKVVDESIVLRKHLESKNEDIPSHLENLSTQSPAFERYTVHKGKKTISFIRLHPLIMRVIQTAHLIAETAHPVHYPMFIQPRPWSMPDVGAYLSLPCSVARASRVQMESIERADLSRLYNALNVLSAIPWRINKRVLDVFEIVWANGGGFAGLPDRNDEHVPSLKDLPKLADDWNADHKAVFKQYKNARKINSERHSLRFDTEYKLEVARMCLKPLKGAKKGEKEARVIYFPHNVDFRGRAYPIPPHLHHMGSDNCRGLLMFAEKRALGEHGLFWLKVHIANLSGNDKITFAERACFTDSHIDDIKDSALHPLDGKRWWSKAEDPWQCLAACFELINALDYAGGAHAYESALPVHMDGSCNGLQHYAALGLDLLGATSVNLTPSKKPQDVYMDVCERVRTQVKKDASNNHAFAKVLDGHIDRKIVKQTVMTSVYGVTMLGAREQVQRRLEERSTIQLDQDEYFFGAFYIAKLTLKSLAGMFCSAQKIRTWLAESASLIAKTGLPVAWVTPLGLPVQQPYHKTQQFLVRTQLQRLNISANADASVPANSVKQAAAMPPNFVHSIDSTHMMMTAIACRKEELVFAAVHDSYWTHACSVPDMNKILREQFVELHSEPLLENLAASFRERFPDCEFKPVPKRGQLDIRSVLESSYFFS